MEVIDCLLAGLANRQLTEKHNTYQLLYTICTVNLLMIGYKYTKHVDFDWRNKLRINSASSWFLLHGEDSVLTRCCAVTTGKYLPALRRNVHSSWIDWKWRLRQFESLKIQYVLTGRYGTTSQKYRIFKQHQFDDFKFRTWPFVWARSPLVFSSLNCSRPYIIRSNATLSSSTFCSYVYSVDFPWKPGRDSFCSHKKKVGNCCHIYVQHFWKVERLMPSNRIMINISRIHTSCLFRRFRKISKSDTIGFVISVCLSVRPSALNNSAPAWRISWNLMWAFCENMIKFKFHYNLTIILNVCDRMALSSY
jgi:hypothetical protein